ncbi:response regulator transcription factor [Clostridium botulinum]|uniref:response regulator transcription factor n=1 Tax=Clostridium botulinum TaxID=1491 RepID=UPI001A9115FD|nr:response regulator transcription factor [Clostridium botulinum]MBO0525765.1 response regulator transcription factor [Clostridium botulinum]MBO0528402.1 response regulator transcription factor [Clostridium botulinum]MBO0533059.1 response regulator transcription factor [Clostridium botulinum]MBO0536650.1 response regulator transcription factor [Clostridium botulinum]MBO0539687.1 response regulator transcription factor [Clostridium botulinum]
MFKILVVEDDEIIGEEILTALRRTGYEGKRIENFNMVIEEFIRYKPHLVLLDINLPVYDGFYWCGKIRMLSKVPIIFISSRTEEMDIIVATNMGGDDYVTKPFSLNILLTKINALLRRTYSYFNDEESDVIAHKNLILNLRDDTIMYSGQKLQLTRNEFKILHILMKNKGTIVSRDRIIRGLWHDESFVDDNTLTVNITRLRKKLKDIGLEDYIQTQKSVGYMV